MKLQKSIGNHSANNQEGARTHESSINITSAEICPLRISVCARLSDGILRNKVHKWTPEENCHTTLLGTTAVWLTFQDFDLQRYFLEYIVTSDYHTDVTNHRVNAVEIQ